MSKVDSLLSRLIVATKGVSTAERQAEARVMTNQYFDFDRKELRDAGLLGVVKEVEARITALRAGTTDPLLIEVYDASLSVFTKWTDAKEAA